MFVSQKEVSGGAATLTTMVTKVDEDGNEESISMGCGHGPACHSWALMTDL